MKEKCKNKTKQNNRTRGGGNYSEKVRDKWFCLAFKLDYLQLICKASSIFKSNLESASSIISKERELYESKHTAVECRCLKIWDLLSFLICSSILISQFLSSSSLILTFSLQNSLQIFENLFLIWCDRLPIYGNLK